MQCTLHLPIVRVLACITISKYWFNFLTPPNFFASWSSSGRLSGTPGATGEGRREQLPATGRAGRRSSAAIAGSRDHLPGRGGCPAG